MVLSRASLRLLARVRPAHGRRRNARRRGADAEAAGALAAGDVRPVAQEAAEAPAPPEADREGGLLFAPDATQLFIHTLKEDIRIVRYADDFVLMGKEITGRILGKLHDVLKRMDLELNTEKTKHIDSRKEKFDFIGFTFHNRVSRFDKSRRYYHIHPANKSLGNLRTNIKECLRVNRAKSKQYVISKLNPIIKGWINYFRIPNVSYVSKTARMIDEYLWQSLYRFHKRKSQRYNAHYSRIAYYVWKDKFKLVDPRKYCKAVPAKA